MALTMAASVAPQVRQLATEGEPSPLFPHTSELIVGIVAFVLLYLFLRAKVFPLFEKAYAERTAAIEGGMQRAEQAQREAQAALEQYRAQLADARHEAARLREEAREEGAMIIAEMRAQAQAEAGRITSAARAQIETDRQMAMLQLRAQVGTLAVELASRIVRESLEDDARQRRVVDRFLGELEQVGADGQAGRRGDTVPSGGR